MKIAAQLTRKRKGGPLVNLDGVTFVVVVNDTPFVVGISGEDIEHGNALWIDTSGPEPMVSARPVFTKPKETPDPIELLRQAEWSGGDIPACPWCGRTLPRAKGSAESHAPDCPVAPILYPKEHVK